MPVKETVHNFSSGRRLVGITCEPSGQPKPTTFVFLNAGIVRRSGPSRSYVMLARNLADAGYPSFRFDLPGLGDSGLLDESKSIEENHSAGISSALDFVEGQGMPSSVILIGVCRGASEGLRYAPKDPRVRGLVLIDPPELLRTVGWHVRRCMLLPIRPVVWWKALMGKYSVWDRVLRLREPRRRGAGHGTNSRLAYRDAWRRIAVNQVKCLMMITSGQKELYSYRRQLFQLFPGLGLKEHVQPLMMPAVDHTLSTAAARKSVLLAIVEWRVGPLSCEPNGGQESEAEPG